MKRGVFISFEGIEGSGKSTQISLISDVLQKMGISVLLTAEPGGTAIGKKVRELLLAPEHTEMDPLTELLLYSASRRQHIVEVIQPALNDGKVVITDRYSDSTKAYQGYGRGIDLGLIDYIDKSVMGMLKPDLTVLLDMDVEAGLIRNRNMKKTDRLELEDVAFHERVREGYRRMQKAEPDRIKLIDASRGIEDVGDAIRDAVSRFLKKTGLS